MKIAAVAFSNKGKEKLDSVIELFPEIRFEIRSEDEPLSEWVSNAFDSRTDLLFIGASGIAIRSIAPFIKNKLEDPAVLSMDESGSFIIPLLSGHIGGANELAILLAERIGAIPVITTASDVNETFAIDNFAKSHNLGIVNKDGIVKVTSGVLEGKPITVSIKDYPPLERVNVLITDDKCDDSVDKSDLVLHRKGYTIGIGCKKGKSATEIYRAINEALTEAGIEIDDIYAIGTIDIKENEPGIQEVAHRYRIPIISFTAQLLDKAPGEYKESDFVRDTVGVGNVCERAAILSAGIGAKLVVGKKADSGVTIAVAKRFWGQEEY